MSSEEKKGARSGCGFLVVGMVLLVVLIGVCSDSNKEAGKEVASKSRTIRAPTQEGPFSGTSPTCGAITGERRADLQNVKQFCSEGIVEEIVVGAYASREILWVKISEKMAYAMRQDALGAERLVRLWMKGWKKTTGSEVVTVYVEWGDIKIATGQTTAFSGDKVNLHTWH